MSTITAAEMSALTALAASIQQQRAVLPLIAAAVAPVPSPGASAPGLGGAVDARA